METVKNNNIVLVFFISAKNAVVLYYDKLQTKSKSKVYTIAFIAKSEEKPRLKLAVPTNEIIVQ